MKASRLFNSLLVVVVNYPLLLTPMTLDGHAQMHNPFHLKWPEDTVTYVPGRSNQNKTIHITYCSVAIHQVKVRSRDGSIISSPCVICFFSEGQNHRRKSEMEKLKLYSHRMMKQSDCHPAHFRFKNSCFYITMLLEQQVGKQRET